MSDLENEFVTWSIFGYYLYIVVSFFNIILFSLLLLNMAVLPPKHKADLSQNRWAFIVWISTIIMSFTDVFLNFSLVVDFEQECWETDIDCLRCTIGGDFKHIIIMIGLIARMFVILKVIEINFQPFPKLMYPPLLIKGLKAWFWFLFFSINIVELAILRVKMRVYPLKADPDIHVCEDSKDDITAEEHNIIVVIYEPLFAITQLILCALFVRKAWSLYSATKHKIAEKIHTKQGLIWLNNIIKPMVRHSILVIAIVVIHLLLIVLRNFVDPTGMPLYPVENLMIGLIIIMMFPFGGGCFRIFCYCIDKPIARKCIKIQYNVLKKTSESKSNSTMSHSHSQDHSKSGSNKTGSNKTGSNKTGSNKTGSNKKQSTSDQKSASSNKHSSKHSSHKNKKGIIKSDDIPLEMIDNSIVPIPEDKEVSVTASITAISRTVPVVSKSFKWSLFPALEETIAVTDSNKEFPSTNFDPESVTEFDKLEAIRDLDI